MSNDDHNKGQKDYNEGRYDSPAYSTLHVLMSSKEEVEQNMERTADYNKGYENARKQAKQNSKGFFEF